MRYKITFSYNGKNFSGYQKQPGLNTVQQQLEDALTFINRGNFVSVTASGRTDKGVHARNQVAHFDLDIDISLYKLKCAINSNISDDIHVSDVACVDDNFHARYMVKRKKYIYYLNIGEYDVFNKDFMYQYCNNLNVDKMNEAIKFFVGNHNFKSFVSNSVIKDSYVRNIYDAHIEIENNILKFIFVGDGFMQYQVRNMVGTLIKVGKETVEPGIIIDILDSGKYKNKVYCAPSCGLFLENVIY